MLATKVIATGITHLTDARYFAAWEVDYLAFSLGAGGLDWTTLNAMREWITGPEIAVEPARGYIDTDNFAGQLAEHGVHFAILPNTAPASSQKELKAAAINVFVTIPVAGYQSADDVLEMIEETSGVGILDFEAGGITWQDLQEGTPFGLDALREILASKPVYLQISLGEVDPKVVATDYSILGFAVRGSSEEKVGYKSFDDLDPLFEGLEVFD